MSAAAFSEPTPEGYRRRYVGVPEPVSAAMQEVYIACGGREFNANIVGAAVDPASPLHSYFEWDDNAAAIEHRLTQANALVRRVKLSLEKIEPEPEPFVVTLVEGEDAEARQQEAEDAMAHVRAAIEVRAYIPAKDLPRVPGEPVPPAGSYVATEDIAAASLDAAAVMAAIERDLRRLRMKYAGFAAYFDAVAKRVLLGDE